MTDESNPGPCSLFISTFNLNAAPISPADARKWLTDGGAADADLVVLSLQECGTCRGSGARSPSGRNGGDSSSGGDWAAMVTPPPIIVGPQIFSASSLDDDADDALLLGAIRSALSSQHSLVADIAMGEPPTTARRRRRSHPPRFGNAADSERSSVSSYGEAPSSSGGSEDGGEPRNTSSTGSSGRESSRRRRLRRTNGIGGNGTARTGSTCHAKNGETKVGRAIETGPVWYGFVRLLIYARTPPLVASLRRTGRPILVPVGTKRRPASHSSRLAADAAGGGGGECCPDGSPDKGGVCLALPALNLLVCAVHLAGTNEYGVPESVFDGVRDGQLKRISNAVRLAVGEDMFGGLRSIVVGDLNFRVELCEGVEDKARRGRDWQAVADILDGGSDDEVAKLFLEHDRLIQYLNGGEAAGHDVPVQAGGLPSILADSVDALQSEVFLRRNGGRGMSDIVPPTFPFKVCDVHPRPYSDKRTPSWTDRILLSRRLLADGEGGGADGNRGEIVSIASCPDVVVSDHVPVRCLVHVRLRS